MTDERERINADGGWTTSPSITTWSSGGAGGGATSSTSAGRDPISKKKRVKLPEEITEKVMIAILDPDADEHSEGVIWAKVLRIQGVDIDLDSESGRSGNNPTIHLELSLNDVYGNESSDDDED